MGKPKRRQHSAAHDIDGPPEPKKIALASSVLAQPEGTEVPSPPAAGLSGDTKHERRVKEKPLVLCARGITYRYRHLMTDMMQLLPHHKTDSKLDTKHDWNAINEVAELKVLFMPAHKLAQQLCLSRSAALVGAHGCCCRCTCAISQRALAMCMLARAGR